MASAGTTDDVWTEAGVRDRRRIDRNRLRPGRTVVGRLAQRVPGLALQSFATTRRWPTENLIRAPLQSRWRHEAAHARVHQDGPVAKLGERAIPVANVIAPRPNGPPRRNVPRAATVVGLD